MKNKFPYSSETAERQLGGNTTVTGESHDQPKARKIPAERRYDGAENTDLKNSPGRQSADVNDKQS
jgi:hypothetical protein